MWTRNISDRGWIGIDLDSTLAEYIHGQWPEIGPPVLDMLRLVKEFLDEGREVRIMTARVGHLFTKHPTQSQKDDAQMQELLVQMWCRTHLGVVLPVTAVKDYDMCCLFDDRAITVGKNTGKILTKSWRDLL